MSNQRNSNRTQLASLLSKNGSSTKLFRKEVAGRLASPEQLDQLIEVVNPKTWLPLAAIGGLVIFASFWSVFGRLPLNVSGQGVLIRPRRVLQFQSPSAGQVLTLNIQPGTEIEKGDTLGTIDQSNLQQQLEQAQERLRQLSSQTRRTSGVQRQELVLQRKILEQQRAILETNLRNAEALVPTLQARGLAAIEKNRAGLQLRLSQLQSQLPVLAQRVEGRRLLVEEGAISSDTLLQFQQEYFDRVSQVADLETQLRQLDLTELQTQQQFLQNQGTIKEIQTQLQNLSTQEKQLAQRELEQSFSQQNNLDELKRTIAQLQLQLSTQGKIVSPYNGRVLEVSAAPGQMIGQGAQIGSIEAENLAAQLVSLTFFVDRDGKQIESGMLAQVTPSITKRERFGGIVGEVSDVSPFPVTTQSVAALVGNAELASLLAKDSAPVQVTIKLEPSSSTTSGYRWTSSQGPDQALTAGTMTTVRVKIGEIAPIAYVIPLFRSWTGLY